MKSKYLVHLWRNPFPFPQLSVTVVARQQLCGPKSIVQGRGKTHNVVKPFEKHLQQKKSQGCERTICIHPENVRLSTTSINLIIGECCFFFSWCLGAKTWFYRRRDLQGLMEEKEQLTNISTNVFLVQKESNEFGKNSNNVVNNLVYSPPTKC